ncbi:DUF1566 domain-containing protein [Pseudomonas sp. PNPG3]|uniref:DUF1566 domain-containing protein n=1 Tax=Pseudomonas sp. PNPG3 TaxID=2919497 RepID=UPI001FFD669B|nr:DUF1566 domain-containing protein [Pseudomonas sp. PNPG3]MCK2123873.1 DUF1566 domain-containing protein [Pseudomonas sp. PNPG3]
MQALNISIEHLTFNIHAAPKASIPGLAVLGAALAAGGVATTEAPASFPEVGQVWPGEGGINGGYVPARGDVPAHYLIFASTDVGDHAYGRYGEDSKATSKTDGHANTLALLEEGDHPAAKAASEYQADGHTDFHLPAAAQLYQGWLNCPEIFDKQVWYVSSSQFSADFVYFMDFSDGTQDLDFKDSERRVRPVRRKFI